MTLELQEAPVWGDLGGVEIELVMVTPEQAAEWLETNVDNRRFSQVAYDRLRTTVDAGGWSLVSDAIAFDADGRLQNGQHRLTLIASGEVGTVPCLVARGMPTNAWEATDRGRPRKFVDTLRRHGEVNVEQLSVSLRLLFVYEESGMMYQSLGRDLARRAGSEPVLLRFFEQRQDLRDSVKIAKASSPPGLSSTLTGTLHYCFSKGNNVRDADRFFELLREPSGWPEDKPVEVLRQRLVDDLELRARRGIRAGVPEVVKRALTIITFNKWIRGERVRHLRWQAGGARSEPFPQVNGYAPEGSFWDVQADEQRELLRTRK